MERKPYDPSELNPVGAYITPIPGLTMPMYGTPATARENLHAMFNGERPQWFVNQFELLTFCPSVVPDCIARGFVMEKPYGNPGGPGGKDMFGIDWEFVPQVGGSMVRPGNPKVPDITEWEKYITFPDIDSWDWETSARENAELLEGRKSPAYIWLFSGLFERLISFVEMQNAMIALIDEDEQEAVKRLFDKLCDLYEKLFAKFEQYYHPDMVYFHDDWGSQRAPFFSLSTVREMLVPYLKRAVESAHRHGMIFNFHCCGKNELLVPAMIEAGVDAWCGQPMNDFDMLYDNYGDKLVLGIDFKVPEDASDEEMFNIAKAFVEKYKKGNIMVNTYLAPRKAQDYLYELSRKEFSK